MYLAPWFFTTSWTPYTYFWKNIPLDFQHLPIVTKRCFNFFHLFLSRECFSGLRLLYLFLSRGGFPALDLCVRCSCRAGTSSPRRCPSSTRRPLKLKRFNFNWNRQKQMIQLYLKSTFWNSKVSILFRKHLFLLENIETNDSWPRGWLFENIKNSRSFLNLRFGGRGFESRFCQHFEWVN